MRTIDNISEYLQPIEEVLYNEFIPAITGGRICSDVERKLLSLPVKLGGLEIEIITETCSKKYEASRRKLLKT